MRQQNQQPIKKTLSFKITAGDLPPLSFMPRTPRKASQVQQVMEANVGATTAEDQFISPG
jgi:hypothetical protein